MLSKSVNLLKWLILEHTVIILQMVLNGDASPTPVTVKIETDAKEIVTKRSQSQHAKVS